MSEYTQGACHDGAAILKDGQMMTIEEIIAELRGIDRLRADIKRIEKLFNYPDAWDTSDYPSVVSAIMRHCQASRNILEEKDEVCDKLEKYKHKFNCAAKKYAECNKERHSLKQELAECKAQLIGARLANARLIERAKELGVTLQFQPTEGG